MTKKNKGGRPSKYSPEVAAAICAGLAAGKTLIKICEAKDMPGASTVFEWLGSKEGFPELYARARAQGADFEFEEMAEIEQQILNGEIEPQAGRVVMDSRKWRLGKKSGKYSDNKHRVEHTGLNGGPIKVGKMDSKPLDKAIESG